MAKVVSLSRVRKSRARVDARAKADANAIKHGLTKAEKAKQKAEIQAADTRLDQHKTDMDRRDAPSE